MHNTDLANGHRANRQKLSLPAKLLLALIGSTFAIAIVILIITASSAATVTGRAPALAISLSGELNTGILGPGEQRWFKFTPAQIERSVKIEQSSQVEQAFTLFFTPGADNLDRVALQLFEEEQLLFFNQERPDQIINFGAGQVVSRDGNPRSGELFWAGWLFREQNYYIQVVNDNEVAIDYWLFSKDIPRYPLDTAPETLANVTSGDEQEPPQTPPTSDVAGSDGRTPQTAITVQTQLIQARLDPSQETWYSFTVNDHTADYFEETSLSLFATPNQQQQINKFALEIFTSQEIEQWILGKKANIYNVGVGSLEARDNDPFTGERFWTGWLVENDRYYIRVSNSTDNTMDYWLFFDDIYHPELGQVVN